MRRHRASTGLSAVELIVASAISAGLLLAGLSLAHSTRRDAAAASKRVAVSIRVAEAADKIVRDLQVSGITGEDRNANGVLDSDEDTNNNRVLDADWNLADNATVSSVSFNKVEQRWFWSTAVTYAVEDGVLLRSQDGVRREICRGITQFSLTRSGQRVDITLAASGTDDNGERWTETATRRVYVRN